MADCSLATGDSNLDLEEQSYRRKLHSFYEVKEEIGRYSASLPWEPCPLACLVLNPGFPGSPTQEPPAPQGTMHSGVPTTQIPLLPGNPTFLRPPLSTLCLLPSPPPELHCPPVLFLSELLLLRNPTSSATPSLGSLSPGRPH